MPAGKVLLHIFKKNKPSLQSLFESLERNQITEILAGLKKKDKRRWRPDGINKYGLLIYAIEKICFSESFFKSKEQVDAFDNKIGFVPKYKITAKLVSMNGIKGKSPEHFCYSLEDMKDKVELYLFGRKAVLVYEEYLTL